MRGHDCMQQVSAAAVIERVEGIVARQSSRPKSAAPPTNPR